MCVVLCRGVRTQNKHPSSFLSPLKDLHKEIFSLFTDLERAAAMASSSLHSFSPHLLFSFHFSMNKLLQTPRAMGLVGINLTKTLANLEQRASPGDTEQDAQLVAPDPAAPTLPPQPSVSPGWAVESPGLREAMGTNLMMHPRKNTLQWCHRAFRSVTN